MVLYVTKNRGKLLIFGKVGCLWQCVVRMFLQPLSPPSPEDKTGSTHANPVRPNSYGIFYCLFQRPKEVRRVAAEAGMVPVEITKSLLKNG